MKRNFDGLTRKERKHRIPKGKLSQKRMDRIARNAKMTVDHLIAHKNGGTEHPDNKHNKRKSVHEGKHGYLGTQLPHNQIKTILHENFPVLYEETREQIVEEIEQILEYHLSGGTFYKKSCFKKGRMPKK